jgi:hypothetical protein|nr:MAG TPA: hypothetical protein [Caudoviricetes sp.]
MEKKNNKGKFIKVGNSISFKFSTDGLDYDLQPGSVYTVSYDRYEERLTLSEAPSLKLPEKVYSSESDDKFMKKILNRFQKSKDEVKSVLDFIVSRFGCVSFDNVSSFAQEINENPKDTFEELFNDMNLSVK